MVCPAMPAAERDVSVENGGVGGGGVCHPRKHKEQYSPVDSPGARPSVAGCLISPGRRREHNQPRAPDLPPRQGPWDPHSSPWSPSATLSDAYHPLRAHLWATGGSKQLPGPEETSELKTNSFPQDRAGWEAWARGGSPLHVWWLLQHRDTRRPGAQDLGPHRPQWRHSCPKALPAVQQQARSGL